MGSWKEKIVNHSWQNEPISMYQYIIRKSKSIPDIELVHLFIFTLGEEEGVFWPL